MEPHPSPRPQGKAKIYVKGNLTVHLILIFPEAMECGTRHLKGTITL
jgi:hypothetical protein